MISRGKLPAFDKTSSFGGKTLVGAGSVYLPSLNVNKFRGYSDGGNGYGSFSDYGYTGNSTLLLSPVGVYEYREILVNV